MDIAMKKLDLVQRLLRISDEAALQRVATVIEREAPEEIEEDFTDAEIAEFDEAIAKDERGEVKFHTEEGSIRLIRSGTKG